MLAESGMTLTDAVRREAEELLYHEAALLDGRRFEEWLSLFTPDARYQVPSADDAADGPSIVDDDHTGLRARVAKLLHPLNPTQQPPLRTQRLIGNVLVREADSGAVRVTSSQVVYVAHGARQTYLPGRCEHVLRPENGQWRISRKTVTLLAADQPQSQLPIL
jgi:3-phenylpropionate/cinnamic acid dioxygenase small subunit